MLTDDKLNCRVCGYRSEVPPWGGDGRTPLYDFCPCCGVEHGYQDSTRIGARKYRDRWIAAGAEWEDHGSKPEGWLISEQLAAVSSDFQ